MCFLMTMEKYPQKIWFLCLWLNKSVWKEFFMEDCKWGNSGRVGYQENSSSGWMLLILPGILQNYVKPHLFQTAKWFGIDQIFQLCKESWGIGCIIFKSIFTDDMEHKHVDKIMAEKETFGLLVCRYQIDDKDVNIFFASFLSFWTKTMKRFQLEFSTLPLAPCSADSILGHYCLPYNHIFFSFKAIVPYYYYQQHQKMKNGIQTREKPVDSYNKFNNNDSEIHRNFRAKISNTVFVTITWMQKLVCNVTRMENSVTFGFHYSTRYILEW